VQKAGAFKTAAEEQIALICPDTSPRGVKIEGDNASWDFGVGAGFYVNATNSPWKENYNMYDYVTKELPQIIKSNFPVNGKQSISGHSMGGHGALISYLKNPGKYESCSAFAPIVNPINCPWGKKAFSGYLGEDTSAWKQWDATELISSFEGKKKSILIDQGSDDEFLKNQLLTENFEAAAKKASFPVKVRYQEGYDHSYFFISTFIEEHIKFHAQSLKA